MDVAGISESRTSVSCSRTTKERGFPDIVVRLDRIPLTDTSAIEQIYVLTRTTRTHLWWQSLRTLVRDGHGYRILRKRDTACGEQ